MIKQISEVKLPNLEAHDDKNGNSLFGKDLSIVENVEVDLRVEVGSAILSVKELYSLKKGSLILLDQIIDSPLKLYIQDRLIGYGKLVAVDNVLGFQITSISDLS